MIKRYKKKYSAIYILLFLVLGFFCLSANKVSALTLEAQYPTITISNQSASVATDLPGFVKYLFFLGIAVGFFCVFVSLAIAGAMYILSPVSVELKTSAKDRVTGAISGLLILAFTYLIVTTLNPQLSILNSNSLPPAPPTPTVQQLPGVYFYTQSGCPSASTSKPNTADVPDLGTLKNKINSVGIVQGNGGYITILYNSTNFQGKCQYLKPNQNCQTVGLPTSSASILNYNSSPSGDGVYFYHEPCFNKISNPDISDINGLVSYCNGLGNGYYEVKNSDIINGGSGKLYVLDLNHKQFSGVPEDKQDCIKYNNDGECAKDSRQEPSLGGNNIASMIINGPYVVLFVYSGPKDNSSGGPWTYCQAFPTTYDSNKIGSQQIKWENIDNQSNVVPNYAIIIPVQT